MCLCAILALTAAMPAAAQSNDVLNRLKQMEKDIDTLNRAVYKGETPPPVSSAAREETANLEVRLGQLETDLRNMTGKVEQQSYDIQQLQQKLDMLAQDSKMRLDALEQQTRTLAAAPSVATPPPVSATTTPATTPSQPPLNGTVQPLGGDVIGSEPQALNPQTDVTGHETGGAAVDAAALYEQGYAQIKAENYEAAEKTFASFMKQYPKHSLAPNALYWLGETYYARKDYDKASRAFAEAYQKYPNGPKGADNLLKLGLALAGKGEKDNACIALGQLKKQYPKGPETVLQKGDQEMQTLGCK